MFRLLKALNILNWHLLSTLSHLKPASMLFTLKLCSKLRPRKAPTNLLSSSNTTKTIKKRSLRWLKSLKNRQELKRLDSLKMKEKSSVQNWVIWKKESLLSAIELFTTPTTTEIQSSPPLIHRRSRKIKWSVLLSSRSSKNTQNSKNIQSSTPKLPTTDWLKKSSLPSRTKPPKR